MKKKKGLIFTLLLASFMLLTPQLAIGKFSFAVTADQRSYTGGGTYNTSNYFRGVVEAIATQPGGSGAFMISPGDLDPPADSKWTIEEVLGSNYIWYPVVGNHELPDAGSESDYGANMAWLRAYGYGAVTQGPSGCPETTYSFDYENVHFVILNEYCDTGGDDVTHGNIPDHLYNWLLADLSSTTKEHIIVFGHEPAYPQPDADNGRLRHEGDSLNQYPLNRDRFWNLLRDKEVLAYISGHTHNYSIYRYDGVWQLDVGHARGAGDVGAPSTFVIVNVDGSMVTFDTYRDIHDDEYDYDDIIHSGTFSLTEGCGNGICESGEDCFNCTYDCISGGGGASECGNGICESGIGEDCLSCPTDCAGKQGGKPSKRFCCGDGDGTNPVGCEDPRCTKGEFGCGSIPVSYCCGDGDCKGDEDSNNCELDCGPPQEPVCGNGVCEGGEDSHSCPADCSSCIPTKDCNCNGKCGKKENSNCPDCW